MRAALSRLRGSPPLAALVLLLAIAVVDLAVTQAAVPAEGFCPEDPRCTPGDVGPANTWTDRVEELEASYADRVAVYALLGVLVVLWAGVSGIRSVEEAQRRRFFVSMATTGVASGVILAIAVAGVGPDYQEPGTINPPLAPALAAPVAAIILAAIVLADARLIGLPRDPYVTGAPLGEPGHDEPPSETARGVGMAAAAWAVTALAVIATFIAGSGDPGCEGSTPDWVETARGAATILALLGIGLGFLALLMRRPFTSLAVLLVNGGVLLLAILSSGALCT